MPMAFSVRSAPNYAGQPAADQPRERSFVHAAPNVGYRWFSNGPISRERARGAKLGSCRSGAQLPFVIALSERRASRAQDVAGGYGVEMEVRQREGGLRREGEPLRTDPEVQFLARPAFRLIRGEGSQRVSALPTRVRKSANGTGPTSAGGSKTPVLAASSPHTAWCQAASIWKCNGAMSAARSSFRRPVRFAGRPARSGRRVISPSTFQLSRRLDVN